MKKYLVLNVNHREEVIEGYEYQLHEGNVLDYIAELQEQDPEYSSTINHEDKFVEYSVNEEDVSACISVEDYPEEVKEIVDVFILEDLGEVDIYSPKSSYRLYMNLYSRVFDDVEDDLLVEW